MENEIFQETKVSKAYIRLSVPLVLSMVVTLIYNLADTFFVAQTNPTLWRVSRWACRCLQC